MTAESTQRYLDEYAEFKKECHCRVSENCSDIEIALLWQGQIMLIGAAQITVAVEKVKS